MDRNIAGCQLPATQPPSLSARRAWIEIGCWLPDHSWWLVALRKESVDRNIIVSAVLLMYSVALRKESVDRNLYYGDDLTFSDGSLSARRAWIEIGVDCAEDWLNAVALRKESVDRNRSSRICALNR